MACRHPIFWRNGWIFSKLVHLYCCDTEKNWLDFGDLDPFSRSHKGLDCWKMACQHTVSWRNGWILTKFVHLHCCVMEKNWLDFGGLDPIFKVTLRLLLLENGLLAPCLLKEWMNFEQTSIHLYCCDMEKNWLDFDQTCTSISMRHGKEPNRFWWLTPFSRLH